MRVFGLAFAICFVVSTVGVKLDEDHDWNTSLEDAGHTVDAQDGGQFIAGQGQNEEPTTAEIFNLNEQDMPEYSQELFKRAEWNYYPYKWCTLQGRVLIAYNLRTYQECQQRCLQKPGCKAIERWSKYNYACFQCTKPLLMTPFTNTRDLAYPAHVWVLRTPNDREWKYYPYKWCTTKGRVLIAYNLKTYQECQQRCLQKPGCKAIERWSKYNYACYQCTNPSLMTPYTDTRDLAYPAHVWVLQTPNAAVSEVSVDCRQNEMSITLPKTLLHGMSREHLTLTDEKCVATETKTHYTLTTPLTRCGTIARHAKNAVVYTNRVQEIPVENNTIITRLREIEIRFSCFYKNSGDAIAVGVKPHARKLVFEQDGKGNFTVALDLFKDEKFTSLYTAKDFPVDVKLRADLFFQASVVTKDKQLSILAEHCYATPSANRNDTLKYQLIKDGCPVDTTTAIIPSTQAAINRFKTEALKFISNHPFVFVHCHIRICDAANTKSRCAQGCLKIGRKRRDIISSQSNDQDKLYPLAQGPLMLAEQEGGLDEKEASTANGITVPAVVAMAILSAVCLTGMAYFARRRSKRISVYDPVLTSCED